MVPEMADPDLDESSKRSGLSATELTPLADAVPVTAERGSPSGTLNLGQVLADRYKILRFIGQGGMGEVYETEDRELGDRVALKTIRPEVAAREGAVERFKREIQLARKVTHPNVCRIFDLVHHRAVAGATGEGATIFLTMELLVGETLSQLLRRTGRMTTAEAFPLVAQMAAALAAAHKVGIVHRDFKSGNVMLVGGLGAKAAVRPVVMDFGLALRADSAEAMTASGSIIGTPAYMAPEQIEGGEITPATDIYALGVIMYEMITGSWPFDGLDAISIARQRLQHPAPSPRRQITDLDPRWEQTILHCLQRYPEDRFAKVEDVVTAIEPVEIVERRTKQRSFIPFGEIADALKVGQVVPFLGAGVNFDSRPPGLGWDEKLPTFVPTVPELSRFLAKKSNFPSSSDQDLHNLAGVASYFVDTSARRRLRERLHEVFDRDFLPCSIHTYLAGLSVPLLVVTTNYDDLLERAFLNAQRPFDLVIHPTDRKDVEASVLWWKHGATEPLAIPPNQLFIDLQTTTVIYKMHGTVDRTLRKWDSFVITEEDHMNLISRMSTQTAIPPIFVRHFRQRHFLFLGYRLRDWNSRVVPRTLKALLPSVPCSPDDDECPRSWAVAFRPSPWEIELWSARQVKVYDLEISDFVRGMRDQDT
jgi:serine/threonine protein kinase